MAAVPICFRLLAHVACRAFSRAWAKTGKRIAAKMAMIAITTSNSIRVNALRCRIVLVSSGVRAGGAARSAPRVLDDALSFATRTRGSFCGLPRSDDLNPGCRLQDVPDAIAEF